MTKPAILLLLAFVVCTAGAASAAGVERAGGKSVTQSRSGTPDVSTISVNGVTDIDPAKAFGTKEPALVIEIFSDFQCPMCKELYETTLRRLMENYVTGAAPCKVYIVHRDFTWPYHAHARLAASYSRAAAHVGKCEEVEAALFANQQKWESTGGVRDIVAAVLSPTEMKKVERLVDAKTLEPLIDRDQQLGLALPVKGTPTLVFHTRDGKTYPITGIVSYEVLKNFVDQLLRQS
jgi:protein-disulfide isomerase